MSYDLAFTEEADGEGDDLDNSIRAPFKKKIKKVLEEPHIPGSALRSMPNCYKIKLRNIGYRLVYEVDDTPFEDKDKDGEKIQYDGTVTIITVGRKDSNIYKKAEELLGK